MTDTEPAEAEDTDSKNRWPLVVLVTAVSLLAICLGREDGLPDEIRLITRGGGFVADGEQVIPVAKSDSRG